MDLIKHSMKSESHLFYSSILLMYMYCFINTHVNGNPQTTVPIVDLFFFGNTLSMETSIQYLQFCQKLYQNFYIEGAYLFAYGHNTISDFERPP